MFSELQATYPKEPAQEETADKENKKLQNSEYALTGHSLGGT